MQHILSQIAQKHQCNTILKQLNGFKKEDYILKAAFLGEFSSGKTSLVNALIKKKFLPMYDRPTTGILTEIHHADENRFELIEYQGQDKKVTPIEISSIAQEVQKTTLNTTLKISLKESNVVDDHTVLIDTPGVASINDTHSDVTYGYLPMVDVAFIVINMNIGSMSESLLKFVQQYPEEVKSKLYFVLTHMDTKSEEQIDALMNEFRVSLSEVIANPKLLCVSSKWAIEANSTNDAELLHKSGILNVEKVITEEIPNLLKTVQDTREKEYFGMVQEDLVKELESRLELLDYDDDQYFDQLKTLRADQSKLIEVKRNLNEDFNKTKKELHENAMSLCRATSVDIIACLTKSGDPSPLLESMIVEIQRMIEGTFSQFENSLEVSSDHMMLQVMHSLRSNVEKIFQVSNKFSQFANHALVAWVAPGAGLMNIAELGVSFIADEAIKGDVKNIIGKSATLQGINSFDGEVGRGDSIRNIAASLLGKLNVVGMAKDLILSNTMQEKVTMSLLVPVTSQIDGILGQFKKVIDKSIKDDFEIPFHKNEEAILHVQEKIKNEEQAISEMAQVLQSDIRHIKSL